MFEEYDIIVVGAGHAGCEAAVAAGNMGSKVLLITMNMNSIADMSCNPAMGGVAKGQIVREIDALGGYAGIVTDQTMIQFRMLNKSKGPAMWSPRAQSDRKRFAELWRLKLEQHPQIDLRQDMVETLIVENGVCIGVNTSLGMSMKSKTVVLTNGTFLNGRMHIGEKNFGGGRAGERASIGLTEQLVELGFESGRMKTGTPPRVDGRSIDYSQLEEQPGDEVPLKFSYTDTKPLIKQRPCHIAYTNPEVHALLRTGFDQSPMFAGRIQGIGPRYCPSIEDKIDRFSTKDRHQLFVEPEGWDTVEVYLNGFSTSLPEDVQLKAVKSIPGFENAKFFRPGYAIEYDYFPPTQLQVSLETKKIQNLFFAGQINGTTGYEEAGAQGLIAGINAHQNVNDQEPLILKRSEAYIGVLIDDLVNKGTDEPYRMFTSRAEFRTLLRQDNADIRLTRKVAEIGMNHLEDRLERVQVKLDGLYAITKFFEKYSVDPILINSMLTEKGTTPIKQKLKLISLVSRPQLTLKDLKDTLPELKEFINQYDEEIQSYANVNIKYQGYIQKEQDLVEKMNRLENVRLKDNLDYNSFNSISIEARQKLNKIKPRTIGQASRISGVSPSDISVLLVYVGR